MRTASTKRLNYKQIEDAYGILQKAIFIARFKKISGLKI
jgi:hypothetical protein